MRNDRLVPIETQKPRDIEDWLYPAEVFEVDKRFENYNTITAYNSKYKKSVYDSKVVNMKKMKSMRPKSDMRGVITDIKTEKIEEGQRQRFNVNDKIYDYDINVSRPTLPKIPDFGRQVSRKV